MDLRKLKTLIDLVSESNVSELEITEAEGKVRIVKGPVGGPVMVAAPVAAPVVAAAPLATAAAVPAVMSEAEQAAAAGHVVKSPMVGTFYRSPSPEAPSYVNVGDIIEPGQVICIIEAMKLMNEIKSEVRGKIVDIQADNAEPVEFGQVLFVVEQT